MLDLTLIEDTELDIECYPTLLDPDGDECYCQYCADNDDELGWFIAPGESI